MQADWYVDPLGRYEGRFFDGNDWTDQVKENGRLALDPDWNRPTAAPDSTNDTVRAEPADQPVDQVVDEVDPVDAEIAPPTFDARSPRAVEPVISNTFATATQRSNFDTDFTSESPTRQVAVFDAEVPGKSHAMDLGGEARSKRSMFVFGALLLAVALAVVLLPRVFSGDEDLADPVVGTEEVGTEQVGTEEVGTEQVGTEEVGTEEVGTDEANTVEQSDTAEPTASDDEADVGLLPSRVDDEEAPTADDAAGTRVLAGPDSIAAGGLEVLNGKPSLIDLAAWHRSSLGAAATSLPDGATCWFGRLGEAVVQNAHCGPVAASTPEEVRFDLIPLKFEDISEGLIQVRALTDATITDAVLPNGLILVGLDGELDPSTFETAPIEGDPAEEQPTRVEDDEAGEAELDGDRGQRTLDEDE